MKDKEVLWLLGFTALLFIIVWVLSPTIINRVNAQDKAEQEKIQQHTTELLLTGHKEVQ